MEIELQKATQEFLGKIMSGSKVSKVKEALIPTAVDYLDSAMGY